MANEYLLGLDVGTQSVRAGLFTLEGKPVTFATFELETDFPRVSWAEQNPDDWWEGVVTTVRKCMQQAGLQPEQVVGIGLDATACTPLPVDADCRPLRPALLWMDQRAFREAQEVTATGDPVLQYAGGPESPEWMIPKCLWLKRNEPEIYAKAFRLIECTDYLVYHLTGEWTASLNNLSCKWNYVPSEGGWPVRLLKALDFEDVLEKWPQHVVPYGEKVGELTPRAAEQLGLKPGTPVAEGGIDAYAGMLGLGVVEPGPMGLIMGTSTCHMALAGEAVFGSSVWGPFPDALLPGTYVLEGGQTSTGSIMKWFADNFAGTLRAKAEAKGKSVYALLDELAAAVPCGSEGLVLLDYFQGNRTPLRDPLARGAVWGLSLKHGPGHLFRAIIEGIAYGTRHILEDVAQAGYQVSELRVCGGGANSDFFLQIHADVCQVPLHVPEVTDAVALGSAICAANVAGLVESLPDGARKLVKFERTIEPNPANKEIYDFYFDKYVRTYPKLKELMHEVQAKLQD